MKMVDKTPDWCIWAAAGRTFDFLSTLFLNFRYPFLAKEIFQQIKLYVVVNQP